MNLLTSLTSYLRASRAELQKVAWPSREETIRYSVIVTLVCIATAAFFATLDYSFRTGLDFLVTNVRPAITTQTAPTDAQPVTPDVTPATPDANAGGVQAVDENGNPANVDVQSLPLDALPTDTGTNNAQ